MWAGLAVVLVGVALGFVKSGDCSSVFIKRDEFNDNVADRLAAAGLGTGAPDCSNALDLTIPVWGLLGVGGLLLGVGAVIWGDQRTASRLDDEIVSD